MRFAAIAAVAAVLLTSTAAHASKCTEVSDVVGEEKCTRYGARWSLEGTPPFFFRFGMRYSEITTANLDFSADKTKGESQSIPYKFRGQSLGFRSLGGVGADGGFGFFVLGQLYTGLDSHLSFGHVTTRATSAKSGSSQILTLAQDSGVNVFTYGGTVPIGYRIPLGRAAIRGEVGFGIDTVAISHQVSLPNTQSWTGSASAVRGVIEPRIAAEVWFTQHMAFSVTAGINVVGNNADRSLGLSLAWHFRAFDGGSAF